ncbi:MAG: glutamate formimidoyltransferase [Deltaproteobacteria bacterium]|nr:glutamate formimidoyltransferase [Deltaproteobacteria bacterium]
MDRVVECVPNFSEGRDRRIIDAITSSMKSRGATVLDVDMGAAANRTVVTMAGEPEAVEAAAFEAIRTAADLIDMASHSGEHPRMGATDVCPFIPVRGVGMDDCVAMARRLGERVGRELGIPVYLYGAAAATPSRNSLAAIRHGEYEGLAAKLLDPAWAPDFGESGFNPKSGATVIGAREFLIAYNINLNTRDRQKAMRIAVRLRTQGGLARSPDGAPLRDPTGKTFRIPGLFRDVRAVGWVIEEYGIAQISINVLNHLATPLHVIYEEAKRLAAQVGVSITGSEVVGLLPEAALLNAGRFYLNRQGLSSGVPRKELVHVAVRSLDVKPFDPDAKVIEYRLDADAQSLTSVTVDDFVDSVSMDSPVPGGGSVAALCGAMGAALAGMAANLTVRRRELSDTHASMKEIAVEAQDLKDAMVRLVTEDSESFEDVMSAFRLRASNDDEKKAKELALESANTRAAQAPLKTLEHCLRLIDLAGEVTRRGYENCLSDAGVATAAALAGAQGAALNVLINARNLKDANEADRFRSQALEGASRAREKAREVLDELTARLADGP